MFEKLLSFLLSANLFSTAAVVPPKTEYKDAVSFVTGEKIMTGDENGDLMLDKTITRAEMAKMIVLACSGNDFDRDIEGVKNMAFNDVSKSDWAFDYINKAYKANIINGMGDNIFDPEGNITQAQAIKMMLAACGAYFDNYPYDYIAKAVEDGILKGIEIVPDRPATRREVAEIMYNIVNAVDKGMMSIADDADKRYDEANKVQSYGYGIFKTTENITDYNKGMVSSSSMLQESAASAGGSNQYAGGQISGAASGTGIAEAAHANGLHYYGSMEEYESNEPNIFKKSSISPLSTFSIDTDTASYSNMRRFILNGSVPARDSVRTEELINYFRYDTPDIEENDLFGVNAEITDCPWSENKLARITITGGEVNDDMPSNLVFLVDVSGSMHSYNKLPMLKKALCMMVEELGEKDSVSIVTYASGTEVVLKPTNCSEKEKIKEAINSLAAGGGTNGADGLALAYNEIEKNKTEGNNRIILCSDGDFNIGPSSTSELKSLIEEKRKSGIYLTTTGFGMGNYKDNRMELLADYGNGSYYYIDTMREAKRVFCDNIRNTLYTVAEDVKLQIEFNPAVVAQYRLIGYENRKLEDEQFNDDTVDAGELGAGATVTVLYELVMGNENSIDAGNNSEYRYQSIEYAKSSEAFDVKIRYKKPGTTESILKEYPVENSYVQGSEDTVFASAVAMLGLKLNNVIDVDYDTIINMARPCVADSSGEYTDKIAERNEFVQLTEILKYIDYNR